MNKKTITITLILIVTILTISSNFSRSSDRTSDQGSSFSTVASATELDIKGLTCSGCALTARIVLEDQEGVISADVDMETGKALVKFDGDRITPKQLANILNEKTPYIATLSDDPPKTILN